MTLAQRVLELFSLEKSNPIFEMADFDKDDLFLPTGIYVDNTGTQKKTAHGSGKKSTVRLKFQADPSKPFSDRSNLIPIEISDTPEILLKKYGDKLKPKVKANLHILKDFIVRFKDDLIVASTPDGKFNRDAFIQKVKQSDWEGTNPKGRKEEIKRNAKENPPTSGNGKRKVIKVWAVTGGHSVLTEPANGNGKKATRFYRNGETIPKVGSII